MVKSNLYRKGRYCFPNKEYLDKLIELGMLKEYDLSPLDRELHDLEVKLKRELKGNGDK